MNPYGRVYETGNLDALRHNMEAMRGNLRPGTKMLGVVKADGYGTGAVFAARAIDPYVWGYGVATAEEGISLRKNGIEKPVLILGAVPLQDFGKIVEYGLRCALFQLEKAKLLSELAKGAGKRAVVHLAVDTGMGRIGFPVTEGAALEAVQICALPHLEAEGLFTHFAKADEREKEATDRQIERFQTFVSLLLAQGISLPLLHCSNSAGILDLQRANFDMVRAGISIYGIYPSGEVDKDNVKLKPVAELKSFLTYVKTISPGMSISYGGTFTAEREMTVATVPVGYADGYLRNLSEKGEVLIRGRRAKILGRVCMDQFMADVTDIEGVREGDEAVLIGKQGDEEITVEEIAERAGGFPYEILCGIAKRVPRVYLEAGRIIGTKDYFGL